MTGVLLQLAPLLTLAIALLLGHRPGERAIERMRARLTPAARRRDRTARVTGVRRTTMPLLPRGGRLVGAAVAARPPPDG